LSLLIYILVPVLDFHCVLLTIVLLARLDISLALTSFRLIDYVLINASAQSYKWFGVDRK